MSKSLLVRFTKILLDVMFYAGIIICVTVPWIFKFVGRYYSIFQRYYVPFCIIFMISGVFALIILWELRNMFKTVIKEDPFVIGNVKSLKRMGICAFIISACMAFRLVFVLTPAAMVLVTVFLIAGLFSMVLSQVFDKAVTYKLENDFTI